MDINENTTDSVASVEDPRDRADEDWEPPSLVTVQNLTIFKNTADMPFTASAATRFGIGAEAASKFLAAYEADRYCIVIF